MRNAPPKPRQSGNIFFMLFGAVAILSLPLAMAQAQCAAPSALAGTVIFNADHKVMQYCDGADWIGLGSAVGGSSGGGTPVGAVMAFDLAECPDGWSEYLPARGRFIRGIDNGAGNDPDGMRAPGHVQTDALGSHTHGGGTNSSGDHAHIADPPNSATTINGDHNHKYYVPMPGVSLAIGNGFVNTLVNTGNAGSHQHTVDIDPFWTDTRGAHTHTLTIDATGEAETRPKNVALLYCRKA